MPHIRVRRRAGNEQAQCALHWVCAGVVGTEVDGPEHGDLPEFYDASVEGSQQGHYDVHVEVPG